jgi:hypothetical protein
MAKGFKSGAPPKEGGGKMTPAKNKKLKKKSKAKGKKA